MGITRFGNSKLHTWRRARSRIMLWCGNYGLSRGSRIGSMFRNCIIILYATWPPPLPNRYALVKAGNKHSFAYSIAIDYNHAKFRGYYNAKQDCHSKRQSKGFLSSEPSSEVRTIRLGTSG